MATLTVTNGAVTFESSYVVAVPETVDSLIVEVNVPGVEGGDVQYLGSVPKRLTVQGVLKGSAAKSDLDKLRSLRSSGLACAVTLSAFGQTWLQSTYLIAKLWWVLLSGTVNVAEGAVLQFTVDFVSTQES